MAIWVYVFGIAVIVTGIATVSIISLSEQENIVVGVLVVALVSTSVNVGKISSENEIALLKEKIKQMESK